MHSDLTQLTAVELLDLYARGDASPVDATRAVLDRIERLNPVLNAYCLVDEAAAMASARESEARWQRHRGEGAPIGRLDGVPTSIKDLLITRGWPTLRGSRTIDPDQEWTEDAPCVARLREAGAVLVGKTTTPEFGCKAETNSLLTGESFNPWDVTRTPGGSSGGTAAAVAAGLGPLSVGTDGAGSVRIPAAFCGNVGMKPSFGRVPAHPLSPFGTVAHLGPHTMGVDDAALMLTVLKGADARDWTSLPFDPIDYTDGLNAGIRDLHIAYSPTLGYATGVDPEIAAAVDAAVMDLEALGARVDRVDPGIEDPIDISIGLWFVACHYLTTTMTDEQKALLDPDFATQAEIGASYSAMDVHRLSMRRGALGAHMRQFMESYDALITPSVAVPAFPSRPAGWRPMNAEAMLGWTPFSYPFNLTQQPAISVPCGLTQDGLPIGLQIVGRMFEDPMVLRIARAYEEVRPVARPFVG